MKTTCPYCTAEFNADYKRRPRSVEQLARYFKMIALAYQNWPHDHRLRPTNAEDVRTFLQLRAGWGHQIHSPTGEVYLMPKSISFKEMGQADFNHLCDKVSEILKEEIGIDGEELLKNEPAQPHNVY